MTPQRSYLNRRPRSYMERPVDRLPIRQRFLIVCEGERTEPNYFLKFPIPKDSVVRVEGVGANTESLVQKAIDLRDQAREEDQITYDQVWCVFDRDSFEAYHFNQAFCLAGRNNVQIAYSNEAFELWYILHFQYLDTGITRADYIDYLTRELHRKYEKYNPKNPETDKPSTTVHILVEKLSALNWARWNQSK
jgi:hypothetical protein